MEDTNSNPTSTAPSTNATKQHIKIYSWNVNGLRAGLKKGTFLDFMSSEQPDIICLQETKAKQGQAEVDLPEYLEIWNSAERPGYSGTAVFTKIQPQNVFDTFVPEVETAYPWADDKHGNPLTEGRLQTIEFPNFYLVNTYVPNSKRDLSRLKLREQIWDPALLQHLKALERAKPVIICGDFNVANTPLDLARPKDNEHNAGFTEEERQGIKNLLSAGFIDTFRYFNPTLQRYTWWSHWAKARERNIGWRIDYFLVSESLVPHLESANIHDHFLGSDHCPISIELTF